MKKLFLDGTRDFKSTDLIIPPQIEICLSVTIFSGLSLFLFHLLLLRYKYLEKMHEEEMKKILVYLKGFSNNERNVLAQITALWLAAGQISPAILPILINVSLTSILFCHFSRRLVVVLFFVMMKIFIQSSSAMNMDLMT